MMSLLFTGGDTGADHTTVQFSQMFNRNQQTQMAFTPDSGEQQGEIWNAVLQISQQSKVDARLIMAVIMQEVSLIASYPLIPV